MTAAQLALDSTPTWTTDCEPTDRPPTTYDLRTQEMWDLRGQHAGPAALWTATNVPVGSYL